MADSVLTFVFQARGAEATAAQSEAIRAALERLENQGRETDASLESIGKGGGGGAASLARLTASFAAAQLGVLGITQGLQTLRRGFDFIVHSAAEAEEATQRLGFALQQSGSYSAEAVADLQNYAEALGAVTGQSDEAIQRTAALLAQIAGFRGDKLQEVTTAAIDLAAALGIGADQAARLLGKAALGETGTLSRYAILVDEGASNSEKFAQALDQVQQKFGGTAAAVGQTGVGAFRAFKEEVGNVAELIGGPIIAAASQKLRAIANDLRALRGELTLAPAENVFSVWVRDLEQFALFFQRTGKDIEQFRQRAESLQGKIVKEFELRVRTGDLEGALRIFDQLEEAARTSSATGVKVWDDTFRKIRDIAGEGFAMRLNLDTQTATNSLRSFLRELREGGGDLEIALGDKQVREAVAGLRGAKTEQQQLREELAAFEQQLRDIMTLRRELATQPDVLKQFRLELDEKDAQEQAKKLAAKGVTLPVDFDVRTLTPEKIRQAIDVAFVDQDLVKQIRLEVLSEIDTAKTEADVTAAVARVQARVTSSFEEMQRTGSRSAQATGQAYAAVLDSIEEAARRRTVEIQITADTKNAAKAIDIITEPRPPVEIPIVFLPPDLVKTKDAVNLGVDEMAERVQASFENMGEQALGSFGQMFGAMVGVTKDSADAMEGIIRTMVANILAELAKIAASQLFKLLLKVAGVALGFAVGGPAGAAAGGAATGFVPGPPLPGQSIPAPKTTPGTEERPRPAQAPPVPARAQVPVTLPAPRVTVNLPAPRVTLPAPRVNVQTAAPRVLVNLPAPRVSVTPPAPRVVSAAIPAPRVSVSLPAPRVTVQGARVAVQPPRVTVNLPAPRVTVQPAPAARAAAPVPPGAARVPAPALRAPTVAPAPVPRLPTLAPRAAAPAVPAVPRIPLPTLLPRAAPRLEPGALELGRFQSALTRATAALVSTSAPRPATLVGATEAERLLGLTRPAVPAGPVVNISAIDAPTFENWIRSGDGGRVLAQLLDTGRIGE